MKRTLVLAVDRDDDFGVKGRVSTPVIGVEQCVSAANALGFADPEDSDINALYAAISTCMDLQEEGVDAEVALICGSEKVGHKADLEVVAQLEDVLDQIQPDNVVLVGDGAEDEYIYPIISSRAHVDSVKKVFVKQAPNIESSFYVITKMLSEPNKRRRFIAPIGYLVFMISLFILLPDLVIMVTTGDISTLPAISRDVIIMIVGLSLIMYAYSFTDKWNSFSTFVKVRILGRGTRAVMTAVSVGVLLISIIVCYYQILDTYCINWLVAAVRYALMIVWPAIISLTIYIIGTIMDEVQEQSVIRMSNLMICFNLASIGIVVTGLLDLVLYYIEPGYDGLVGIVEILIGVAISVMYGYTKRLYRRDNVDLG